MNIHQRINAVREAVGYIQKDKPVQGYKVVTHDTVTAELRPHLIKNGIIVVPRQVEGETRDSGTHTGSGISIIRYEARYEVDFVNMDEPGDLVTLPISSHALDHGDKAPGKAISYATKYAMLKIFSIETGEDEESRQEQKPKPYSEEDLRKFKYLIDKDDSLGFYLLSKEIVDEDWLDINSAYMREIKRGGKGKEKARMNRLMKQGDEIFGNIVQAIENKDDLQLKENVEDIIDVTRSLLWNNLTSFEQTIVNELMDGK